ncbi:WAS/WASL-interacting protein family member 3-like [Clupea harengus]|uniref:WAS/WASL-interacting protein family member 3-like n=1 Tax=Clupea harengus TaxID=7950 RepID=A0A6P8H397_CLUHA|nr:WAS/WASL-interacting protein family member 3-like [Clupea harengus]
MSRRPPAVPCLSGIGRLGLPPAPPARSPTTELSSYSLLPPPPPPPPPPLPPSLHTMTSSQGNGYLHSLDDFESKFQFHPLKDLPPPKEFCPFHECTQCHQSLRRSGLTCGDPSQCLAYQSRLSSTPSHHAGIWTNPMT